MKHACEELELNIDLGRSDSLSASVHYRKDQPLPAQGLITTTSIACLQPCQHRYALSSGCAVLCWCLQSQVSSHQSTVPVTVVLMAVNIWVHNQECRNCFFMLCYAQHCCVRQLRSCPPCGVTCPRQSLVQPRLHVNMARAGPALVCATHSDNAPDLDFKNRLHVAWSQCIKAVSWDIPLERKPMLCCNHTQSMTTSASALSAPSDHKSQPHSTIRKHSLT